MSDRTVSALVARWSRRPGIEKGVACAGTKLESTTLCTAGKAFVFIRLAPEKSELRLKLGASTKEAAALAAREPARYAVGAGGWTKVTWAEKPEPPLDVLDRWFQESHDLLASAKPRRGR